MPNWMENAACIGAPADDFFPASPDIVTARAAKTCRACPVIEQCLEHALANGEWDGVWAGMSPNDRRRLALASGIPRHGTSSGYTRDGCKCDRCRAEMAELKRSSQARKVAA